MGSVPRPSASSSKSPATGPRILVVEDEFLVAIDLEDTLRRCGCVTVGPAFTLEGGLALARSATLAGALLDLNLAGKSVLPLVRELSHRGVPFAIVSSYEPQLMSAPQLREAPWIRKPYTMQDIKRVVAGWTAPPRV